MASDATHVFRGSVFVQAPPEEVFVYFTEPEALASWMGDRAVVDPRPEGCFVLHIGERVVEGRYEIVEFPRRVVLSWGRRGSVRLPPGSSRLEVTFVAEGAGTRVTVVHDGLPPPEHELHALGWTHYLARLVPVASGGVVPAHAVPASLSQGAD